METPIEPAPTAAASIPSERDRIACKALRIIFLLEKQSSLKPREFWKAMQRLASNDAAMLVSLNNGSYEQHVPNPKDAQKPIEVE